MNDDGKMSLRAFDKKASVHPAIQILILLMVLLAMIIMVNGIGLGIAIGIALSMGADRFPVLGWTLMVPSLISPIHLLYSWKSNRGNPRVDLFMHSFLAICAAVSLCCMMIVYGQDSWQVFAAEILVAISTFGVLMAICVICD